MKRKALLIVVASLLMIGCGGKPAEPSSEVKPPVSSEPAPSSEDKPISSEEQKQEFTGVAFNDLKVTYDGQGKFKSIKISPEAINAENPSSVDSETIEILEDSTTIRET